VIYDRVDDKPAGYSRVWLQDILRKRLHFQGVIFSDDLSMEAAGVAGDFGSRAIRALEAGCDMVLVCNHPEGVADVVARLAGYTSPVSQMRLIRMHGRGHTSREALRASDEWKRVSARVAALDDSPWMELDI